MTIKIRLVDDEIITKTNGTIEEVAKYYFPRKEVVEIEILEGGIMNDTEYCAITATRIYRASEEEIKEFELWNNIRYDFKVEYKGDYILEYGNYNTSAGLCKVA